MRIALAGAGAFGEKHLDGLKNIDGVEIVSIISRRAEQAAEVAAKSGARHSGTELLGSRPSRIAETNSRSCSSMPLFDTATPERSTGSSLPVTRSS